MQITNPEAQMTAAIAERMDALRAGDADAWHVADGKVRTIAAYMRAECKIGLRADPIFTVAS